MTSEPKTSVDTAGSTRSPGKAGSKRIVVADYEVGKYKPPKSGQIQPGERRNPRGRPPKPKIGERVLHDFLNEPMTIEKDGRKQVFTKRELAYLQIANRAAKGDDRAVRLVLAYDLARQSDGEAVDPLSFDPTLAEKVIQDLREEITHSLKSAKPAKPKGEAV